MKTPLFAAVIALSTLAVRADDLTTIGIVQFLNGDRDGYIVRSTKRSSGDTIFDNSGRPIGTILHVQLWGIGPDGSTALLVDQLGGLWSDPSQKQYTHYKGHVDSNGNGWIQADIHRDPRTGSAITPFTTWNIVNHRFVEVSNPGPSPSGG
jgi:hypothetical protein